MPWQTMWEEMEVIDKGELYIMEAPMTPEEFKERMDYLVASHPGDPELFHWAADSLMTGLLILLGYKDGVEVFEQAHKWYA